MRLALKVVEVLTRRPRVDQRRLADSEAALVLPLARIILEESVDRSDVMVVDMLLSESDMMIVCS